MSTTQDIGIVTAYGYAQEGGYEGTVEEFESSLANLPSNITKAEEAVATAEQYKEDVEALAQTISGTVGIDDTQSTSATTYSSNKIALENDELNKDLIGKVGFEKTSPFVREQSDITPTTGYWYNALTKQFVKQDGFKYYSFTCEANGIYLIKVHNIRPINLVYLVSFFNEDDFISSIESDSTVEASKVVIAPNNATKMVVNAVVPTDGALDDVSIFKCDTNKFLHYDIAQYNNFVSAYYVWKKLDLLKLNGYYKTDGTITIQDDWYHELYEAQEGDKFRVTTRCADNYAVAGIIAFDENNIIIDKVANNKTYTDYEYTCPFGTAKIGISYADIEIAPTVYKYESLLTDYLHDYGFLEIDVNKNVVNGAYIKTDGTIVESSGLSYTHLSVLKGDKYRVNLASTPNAVVSNILIKDNKGNVADYVSNNSLLNNYEYTVSCDGTMYLSFRTEATIKLEEYKLINKYTHCISCVGDSLTQGNQDSTGVTYPSVLSNLLGDDYIVKNHGCGGDNSKEICAVTNTYNFYVKPFTIPAERRKAVTVEFLIPAMSNGPVNPAYQNIKELSMVSIDGIIGEITYNYSTGIYSFMRHEDGSEVTLTRPTPIITQRFHEREYTHVIWMGTNDGITSLDNFEDTIDAISSIVSSLSNNRFIILSMTWTSDRSKDTVESVNRKMEKIYGSHFLNIRDYIISYGLEDENITPTETDTEDINAGRIPSSLRNDEIHMNQYGYDIIANLVYKKGKDLCYWE